MELLETRENIFGDNIAKYQTCGGFKWKFKD